MTESILEIVKETDGERWIKIPVFNAESEWGEMSGGMKLGTITPWMDEQLSADLKGKNQGGGVNQNARQSAPKTPSAVELKGGRAPPPHLHLKL